MNKKEIAVHLDSLTAYSPYSQLLKTEANIDVPAGTPVYLQENLYRVLMTLKIIGDEHDVKRQAAIKEFGGLVMRFPWITKQYEDILLSVISERDTEAKPERFECADGTIVFCTVRKKFLLYIGNKVVVRCNTLDATKHYGTKRYSCESFNVVE